MQCICRLYYWLSRQHVYKNKLLTTDHNTLNQENLWADLSTTKMLKTTIMSV